MPDKRVLDPQGRFPFKRDISILKTAFDLVADHIVITDRDAHILYANPAAVSATGFSIADMMGRNPGDLWGGNMPKKFWVDAWRTMKEEKKPVVLEVHNTRKDGSKIWQSLHISPVLNDAGDIHLFIGIEPNITDAKRKEKFRENFLSVLGHKTLGPLTGIQWMTELLCEDTTLSEQQKSNLRELYGDSKTLTVLLNDLLLLSRMGKGHPRYETIDLVKMLGDAVASVSKSMGCHFSFSEPDSEFTVRADPYIAHEFLLSSCECMAGVVAEESVVTVSLEGKAATYLIRFSGTPRLKGMIPTIVFPELIARHLQWKVRVSEDGSILVEIPAV